MQEKEYNVAVFIGRFQPFHNQHLQVVKKALEIADKVLIIIGSHRVAPDIKNPFSYEERVEMIKASLLDRTITSHTGIGNDVAIHHTSVEIRDGLSRIEFIPVRDYYYNDNLWLAEIQQKTVSFIKPGDNVCLMGAYKDASSYYLNLFPQWEFYPINQASYMNATDVRDCMFDRNGELMGWNVYQPDTAYKSLYEWQINKIKEMVPEKMFTWFQQNFFRTEKYHNLVVEYAMLKDYKTKWNKAPFPPIFVTVDGVVVCNGHVLVVKRKFNPGKGLFALPGGFLKQSESIESSMLRELKEETAIKVNKLELKNAIKENKVFDYPGRSLRGRTITHAYHITLTNKDLPELKSGSDAEQVQWMPIVEVYQNEGSFFEDHFHIIQYFLQRG